MAVPTETVWEAEAHTLAKHEILRRYLGAWFGILAQNNPTVIYIDGFCGPGLYRGGEPGSPIVALTVAAEHSQDLRGKVKFLFIDNDALRLDHLREVLSRHKHADSFEIETKCGDFESGCGHLLDSVDSGDRPAIPTFAFVDPFGFSGVPMALIERLLRLRRTEVFITFMVDSVNRFLTHPDDAIRAHLVSLLGTDEVLEVAASPGDRIRALRELYQQKLQSIARFVRYFEMRDTNHRVIYYLFFATNHALGHKKMKESFWSVDSGQGYQFSDATNPDQPVLFELDPAPQLASQLSARFVGKTITGRAVSDFVDDETAFVSKHKTAALKLLESQGSLSVNELKKDGKKRLKGTFADDAVIHFGSAS